MSVAASSTEAEYMALYEAVREALWLKSLAISLNINIDKPIVIFEDNNGCISIANNPINHKRTKHIDIKYHFSREQIEKNVITLNYIPTGWLYACAMKLREHASTLKWMVFAASEFGVITTDLTTDKINRNAATARSSTLRSLLWKRNVSTTLRLLFATDAAAVPVPSTVQPALPTPALSTTSSAPSSLSHSKPTMHLPPGPSFLSSFIGECSSIYLSYDGASKRHTAERTSPGHLAPLTSPSSGYPLRTPYTIYLNPIHRSIKTQ
ncbi:hypothetical protein evm_011715 [Chilo suppressalis]|nr:hypothetical protein evm_011715 [Chilo suppressalis]